MRKLSVGIGLFAGALALVAVARAQTKADEPFKRLTIEQVQALEESHSASIFDNNSRERYDKGHVPTARWVSPIDMTASDLPADKDRPLVFYCGNTKCMACHQGATKAIQFGYRNVSIMPAGIMGWEKAGKPVEK